MKYSINTIPKSYQRLFGNPPKDSKTQKSYSEEVIQDNHPKTTQENSVEYEQWTSIVWNTWIVNVSEQDKIKYRMQDLQGKFN